MPRWFGSSASAAAADTAVAAPPPPPPPPPPPSREELDKLRERVEEVAPRAFASLLASQEPGLSAASEGFDDDTLTRWLVAEERDVERAARRMAAHAEWRSALLPAGWTPDKEAAIAKELAAGKTWFSAAPDSRGRPYILSPSARHARAGRDLAASRLALVYAMDAAARAADAAKVKGLGDGRVVSVIDARGVGLANLDPEVSKMVVEIAQDHYPERSLTTFIFGAPSAFAAIVQWLLPLVSPSSRGKIKFVKAGSDWASAGVVAAGATGAGGAVVDGASLPRVLGGTGPDAVPVQVAARSVGILKDLTVPAVDSPWGVSVGGGGEEEEEEEASAASASTASAASAASAAPATAAAEGKATEQRSGVVSLTATAAL